MSIQIAKAITKSNVIVVDVEDKNLNEAKRMGADERINSGTTDVVRAIKDITNGNGCEAVVDFVNNSKTAPNSINMLRKRGRLIMVGLFGGSLELNLPLIPLRSFTLTGAYTGTFANLVELVNISQQGKIQSVVSRKFNLDDVNQALNDLKNRKIIGRAVINP
jgi:propanol-preferring alcohol dehydrogenase